MEKSTPKISEYSKMTCYERKQEIAEVLAQIPLTIFHTWKVISIFTNGNNFTILSEEILMEAMNIAISTLYKRLGDTLTFTVNDIHLLYRAVAQPIGVDDNGNIKYQCGEIIEIDDDGNYRHPTDQFGNNLPLGFKVNEIQDLLNS